MPRMHMLSEAEKNQFESPPQFTKPQRKYYFSKTAWADQQLNKLKEKNPATKVGFLLLLGYFKAASRFFATNKFYTNDINFVSSSLKIEIDKIDMKEYRPRTSDRHQEIILEHFGFRGFNDTDQKQLLEEIKKLVSRQIKPKQIFLSVLDLLQQKKIEIPIYHTLSEIIRSALNDYEKQLLQVVNQNITSLQKTHLDSLYEAEERTDEMGDSKKKRYRFTMLKRINQSIRPGKIKENILDLQTLQPIYLELNTVIKELNLSMNSIEYYAIWAKKAKIFQLLQKDIEKRYLHSIAFVIFQYFSLQDALIDKLRLAVQSTINNANSKYQLFIFENRKDNSKRQNQLITYVKHHQSFYSKVKKIIGRNELTSDQKIVSIQEILSEKNKPQFTKDEILSLEKENQKILRGDKFYDELESLSLSLQKKVSDIIKFVRFDQESSNKKLLKAITHYKDHYKNLSEKSPTAFLQKQEKKLVLEKKNKFRVSLYKALLFKHTAEAIKSGSLNVTESHRYKSLEEYLIEINYWKNNKEKILEEAGLSEFIDVNEVLKNLKKELDEQYHTTNKHILDGSNKHITFKENGDFILKTPRVEKEIEGTLSELFPKDEYISLLEVLTLIEERTGFLDSFEHHNLKYSKERPDIMTFFAAIIGYGCNIGIKKMSKISKGINATTLEKTINWYFSVEHIHSAIDKILEFITKLELPKLFLEKPDQLHTSSDGQKVNVADDSLNANYSFKYLGKDLGVSVYSYIDERNLSFHSLVTTPSDREAVNLIDGLMHNDVIRSDVHSTDTHGYTEVIFGIMYLLKISFTPRIKGLKHQKLYSFVSKKTYKNLGYKILPDGYINDQIIPEKWDDILRFMATIKLKKTSAVQLFKRLNSYSKHDLYTAQKCFGEIGKTIFILKNIDQVTMRQSTEKQLNKIENSNKFSNAIAFENNHEFIQGTKEEQEIAEGCRRLIKNALVCWNYLYLEKMVEDEKDEKQKQKLLRIIKSGSVATWKHFNFQGEYDFSKRVKVNKFF